MNKYSYNYKIAQKEPNRWLIALLFILTFIEWEHNGKSGKEGAITDETKYIIRIDGDITKDAEMTIRF